MTNQSDSELATAALIDALKHGRIAEAKLLKSEGARVAPQGTIASIILKTYAKAATHRVYSEQLDPDQLTEIVSFQQIADVCGPFYCVEPFLGLDPRPAGWARCASEERVLSVYKEFGLGLVADQALGEPVRYVSEKPMTKFRHALVAGPFAASTEPVPEHLTTLNWERLGVRPDIVDVPAYKEILFEWVRLGHDVQWTHQFGRMQELLDAMDELSLSWSHLNPPPELYLAVGFLQESTRNTAFCLNKAVELDESLSPLACLILFHRTVVRMAVDGEDAPAQLSRDFPRASREDKEWSEAVAMASMQLLLQQEEGATPSLADILPFTKYIGRSERPYESFMIENACRIFVERLGLECQQLSAQFGGNPEPYVEVFKLGFRPPLAWAVAKACEPGFTPLLAYLLDQGVSARGCLTYVENALDIFKAKKQGHEDTVRPRPGYLVPLAHAVNRCAEPAVQMLLDSGADPLEPSHFNGMTSLQLTTTPKIRQLLKSRVS